MNCGSTQFHKVENGWKCDYCGTLYLNPKKKNLPKQNKQQNLPKKRSRILIGVILATMFILISSLSYINYRFNKADTSTYEPLKPGTENSSTKKEFPSKWTQSIYNSVKVATEHYNEDTKKYTFKDGSSYEELEKLVGTPDTVTSWEKEDYGMPPRSTARWTKNLKGDYAGTSITVTYETKTKMITDKDQY